MSKLLDDANYEDIVDMFDDLPMTWYPALIVSLVEAAYRKPVFQPGGASRIIATVEKKLGKDKKDVEKKD